MGSHPINLLARFLLELAALSAMGWWGWRQGGGWMGSVLAAGVSLVAASIWGVFAVPGDPSRSGTAPVPVPGFVRLAIELGIFSVACACLVDVGHSGLALALGIATMVHYAVSYDRILWLMSR